MRMISLTKVNGNNHEDRRTFGGGSHLSLVPVRDEFSTNEEGEGPRPVVEAPAPVAIEPDTSPVMVNAEAIRCFYPRKDNQPGSRITFIDGGGFAVTEAFEEVKTMVQPN